MCAAIWYYFFMHNRSCINETVSSQGKKQFFSMEGNTGDGLTFADRVITSANAPSVFQCPEFYSQEVTPMFHRGNPNQCLDHVNDLWTKNIFESIDLRKNLNENQMRGAIAKYFDEESIHCTRKPVWKELYKIDS